MRVLLASHLFAPSIGGIEQVSEMLAVQLVQAGCRVTVVTQTPAEEASNGPFEIYRQPSSRTLVRLIRSCDVCLQSNLSLRTLWPALVVRRPILAVHHTWITRPDGRLNWQDRLKLFATHLLDRNLAVSKPLADTIPAPCGVIPNPYREDIFHARDDVPRDRDIVFVGRLVSSKGADILIEAISVLVARGHRPNLSVVGTGPEETALKERVHSAKLNDLVRFEGSLSGEALGRFLNRHRILVAPSRWEEPFGLVALEGIASGCAVVASSGGGLSEAVGPCGVIFKSGDAAALAEDLERLLTDPALAFQLRKGAARHLERHKQNAVAQCYLQELSALTQRQ